MELSGVACALAAGARNPPGWYGSSSLAGEMAKTFVAVNDRVHSLLRECTWRAPLRLARDGKAIQYEVRAENLSNSYYSLAAFHGLQGLRVDEVCLMRWRVRESAKAAVAEAAGYFDVTRVDRRCAGDLRLKPAGDGPGMLAAELLAFGTGALRPAGYSAAGACEFREYGRLCTPLEVVYARIGALCCGAGSSSCSTEKETYCSTNVIYGDALGEVEQLWERRADTEFLHQVALHLQSLRDWPRIPAPALAPLNYEAVMRFHLRAQSVWRKPPANGRILLRRIEFILQHTLIDDSPGTLFQRPGRQPKPLSRPNPGQERSGYDGWLGDNGMGMN